MKLMNLLLESLEESQNSDEEIKKAVAKALKIDASKVDIEKAEKGETAPEQEIKEIVGTVITILGLLPAAMELVGWVAKKIKSTYSQEPSKFGEYMSKKGHELHKAYTYPFERFLAGVAYFQKPGSKLKNKEYRQKIANILYAITMLSIAGVGVAKHIKDLAGVGPVLHVIADGVKGGLSIVDIAKNALSGFTA
jgi:hypothetical protein